MEREVQEKIYKWVKREEEKGKDVKVAFARVKIEDKWVKWEEIERSLSKDEGRKASF